MRLRSYWLALFLLLPSLSHALYTAEKDTVLMGSAFAFTAIHESESVAKDAVEAAANEVARIEHMISSWRPDSETSNINRNAGFQPVAVPDELYNLIRRSMKISKITGGAFDITYAGLDAVWHFDGRKMEMPSDSVLRASVSKVGYEKIVLDPVDKTVFLPDSGMKIGFGGIGKGYAANRAKAVMLKYGVNAGAVNAGGDLLTWGVQANGKDWVIGVVHPRNTDQLLAWVNVNNKSVVTSGDYEKFVVIDGRRYGHILNPKTGRPCRGVISATVVCADAEIGDAIATSIFVLGPDQGLKLVNMLNGIEAIIVDDDGESHFSDGMEKVTVPWISR